MSEFIEIGGKIYFKNNGMISSIDANKNKHLVKSLFSIPILRSEALLCIAELKADKDFSNEYFTALIKRILSDYELNKRFTELLAEHGFEYVIIRESIVQDHGGANSPPFLPPLALHDAGQGMMKNTPTQVVSTSPAPPATTNTKETK